MVNFYFVYVIIDLIWKIFSILFVLYKFTSFFTMTYNFLKFLGTSLKKLIYLKNQITVYTRRNRNSDNLDLAIRPKTFFTIFKEKCYTLYNKVFKISLSDDEYLPLYETRTEHNLAESENDSFNFTDRNSIQNEEFNSLLNSTDVFNSYFDINKSSMSINLSQQLDKVELDSVLLSDSVL